VNRRETLLAWVVIAAGFAVIGGGWAGVQSTPVVAVQLAYLASGGIVGLAMVIVGTGLLRHDDLRAIRKGVEELLDRVDDLEHDLSDTKEWLQALEVKRIAALAAEDGARTALRP
jgi:hypothetical protein